MEADYKTFYSYYLKEFHLVKAIYLKTLLSSEKELNEKIKKLERGVSLTDNTKFIIQADLRQNYFHSIETFFELFFALLPENNIVPDNKSIIKRLSTSNWRKNYDRIEAISNDEMKLDFLDNHISYLNNEVSIGHYLFYLGVFSREKFPNEVFDSINLSIEAIKKGIKIIANDFSQRDEYNAYKHAIRIFPSFKSLHVLNAETMEETINWDISNSASYQLYDDKNRKTTLKTKLFDSERDYQMTYFCSNMIYSMIFYRDLVFCDRKREENEKTFAMRFFSSDAIIKCSEHNVEIQNLSFSTEEIKGSG